LRRSSCRGEKEKVEDSKVEPAYALNRKEAKILWR
jgi:hypothetical protein